MKIAYQRVSVGGAQRIGGRVACTAGGPSRTRTFDPKFGSNVGFPDGGGWKFPGGFSSGTTHNAVIRKPRRLGTPLRPGNVAKLGPAARCTTAV